MLEEDVLRAPATGIAKRHIANQGLIKKLALQSSIKSVIKEKDRSKFYEI